MNRFIGLSISFLAISACKSTDPRVEYIESNSVATNQYNSEHKEELGKLTEKLNQECVFKKMNRNDLSFAKLASIPLNGIVIYDLDLDGVISSVLYYSKDNREVKRKKQKCIEDTSIGYKLPPPGDLQRVYSIFNVKFE
jgi:hypothetical protein